MPPYRGWKRVACGNAGDVVTIELEIPEDSIVIENIVDGYGTPCYRTNKVFVVSAPPDCMSFNGSRKKYIQGTIVFADYLDDDFTLPCNKAHGIYFYGTKEECDLSRY